MAQGSGDPVFRVTLAVYGAAPLVPPTVEETSCRFAPVTLSDNGTPRPSTSTWRLLSFFPIRWVGSHARLRQGAFIIAPSMLCQRQAMPSSSYSARPAFHKVSSKPAFSQLQEAGMNRTGTAITLGRQCLLRRQSDHRPISLPNPLGFRCNSHFFDSSSREVTIVIRRPRCSRFLVPNR